MGNTLDVINFVEPMESLPSMGADTDHTTLSGWSRGAGLIAGGGYSIGEFRDEAGLFEYDVEASVFGNDSVTYADNYAADGKNR
jgi:hypothetical protein